MIQRRIQHLRNIRRRAAHINLNPAQLLIPQPPRLRPHVLEALLPDLLFRIRARLLRRDEGHAHADGDLLRVARIRKERARFVLVADEGAGEVQLCLPEAFGVKPVGVGSPDAVFVESLVVAGAEEIVAGEGFVVEGARAEAAYRVRRMTFFM